MKYIYRIYILFYKYFQFDFLQQQFSGRPKQSHTLILSKQFQLKQYNKILKLWI